MSALNIYSHTKPIVNFPKFDDDLRNHATLGPLYDFYNYRKGVMEVHFKQNLNQAEFDEIASFISNFSEISVLNTNIKTQVKKADEGFKLYKDMIAHINTSGGLGGYLDDDQIPAYENHLTPIRNMLKDGFPEFALRKLYLDVGPAGVLDQEKIDTYQQWLIDFAIKYGAIQQTIDLILSVPRGQYPFGAIGAPSA